MKGSVEQIKHEFNAKLLYWNNLKSRQLKLLIIVTSLGLIALKVFTTVLTFDWLSGLF